MAAEVLLETDTVALWQEYHRTRDVGMRNSLVLQNLGLVYRLANQHAPLAGDSLEDLIQEGCLGLIRAVERFEPGYGVRFSTYAYPVILGAIRNYLRSRRRLLGRREVRGEQAEGAGQGAGMPISGAEELVSPEEFEFLPNAAEEDFADQVVTRVLTGDLLGRLPAIERRIVTHFFYDDLSQREIARLIARSNSRVSRLLRRALERLRIVLVEVEREERRVVAPPEPDLLGAGSVVDIETGLFGPAHLRRCLTREIERADSLGAPLSLALLRPSEALGEDRPGLLLQTARYIYRKVRVLDHVFRAGLEELALIFSLPASDAARICERLERDRLPVQLHHAIRSFPHDAGSASGLLAAAQADLGQG
jgi:RNA polymerase sigma factor (sigma-70 family)